ncbi:MAG: phosphoenolpyruvate--protein phosphotransferase [Planctomycetota bacterium]
MPTSATIKGVPISTGLAHGPVHVIRAAVDAVPSWYVREEDLPREFARLVAALEAASNELEARREAVAREAGEQDAEIFSVHRMLLQDPSALQLVEERIKEDRINAESAVQKLIERFQEKLGQLEGASVRDFANDVSDPWRLVLAHLLQRDRESIEASSEQVVLAAAELTPQVVTFLPRERLRAVITETGGRFSHAAVLARSLGIPCVVGLPNLMARLEQDLLVTVDGDLGQVQLRPGPEDLAEFEQRTEHRREIQGALLTEAPEPCVTADGTRFECHVNIESVRDLDTFDPAHTDGVGLLRTEFLYMERSEFPSEEEQYRMYRRVVEAMGGLPVTIRTLDIGGDKPLPYFRVPPEPNPALGWRGLRISLQWPDLLQVQLRALLRASAEGQLRILLPMVGSIDQIERFLEIFDRVRDQLRQQGYGIPDDVPVGVMIEVPSLLFCLPQVFDRVDFVSVGTNDLVQYLLAVDRDNSWVAKLYEPHHPAVFGALANVASAARERGVPATVCGDVAADPVAALLLLGLGFTGVSVAPHFVPGIKHAVRKATQTRAQELVETLRRCERSDEVRTRLRELGAELYTRPS